MVTQVSIPIQSDDNRKVEHNPTHILVFENLHTQANLTSSAKSKPEGCKLNSTPLISKCKRYHGQIKKSFVNIYHHVWTDLNLETTRNFSFCDKFQHGSSSAVQQTPITKAFAPMRWVLTVLGRWPFSLTPVATPANEKLSDKSLNQSGNLQYDYKKGSPVCIYFCLTTLFIFFVLLMGTLALFDFYLEWNFLPEQGWATIKKSTFQDNLVMFLLIWGCLVHSFVSSFSMLLNGKQVTDSLNFFNFAANELRIGSVRRHRRFLITANLGYIIFLIIIYIAYSWWNIKFVRQGATLFGTLVIRPLLSQQQLLVTPEKGVQVFGILIIIYFVYASRSILFVFCFKCRLLRNMFQVWNERLSKYLNEKECEDIQKEKEKSERILREMTLLLKMVKQHDKMFAVILQSYYVIQVIIHCFC